MARKRTDSTAEKISNMASAMKGLMPPKHIKLRTRDMPFWKALVNARAEWTDIDLTHAANLARCQSDIEFEQKKLDKEGSVIKPRKGEKQGARMNPRHSVLEQLSRRSVALSRMLQVHAAATIGESKLNRGKNAAKRDAINTIRSVEDEELMERGTVN